MTFGGALQLSPELRLFKHYGRTKQYKSVDLRSQIHMLSFTLSSRASRQDAWNLHVAEGIYKPLSHVPLRCHVFTCQSFSMPSSVNEIPLLKSTSLVLTRSYHALRGSPLMIQLVPAIGIIAFALWCLGPLMCRCRKMFLHQSDSNWKKSTTYYILTSYLQPFLLWTGAILICRALDPIVLTTEASQVVKQRMLNFVRSLSTVLAFAYCLSSLIQQTQKFFMETSDSNDSRNMGFHFAGRAVYTAVWIAAVSLFMELLGFSTQKWLTAGGLGTVLLTLAGREIFTNFLSSIMIHATRPFVVNEWIQTKIEGYEVSGTVEHVGWWSPTIIRGEDREAVHIPNHKFTVNVVRNLSQKTHWRIKTHLAISHLDANKINNIVADMRKVLAKNPHVEQQRLHRRVFLDNINPENQALLILVSCFVKTSHFEEYLCVKEAIVLDLLRVISHHRARLATPIRTVQKIYGDADIENIPFADSVVSRAGVSSHRPLLLVEPPSRINGDDKAKVRPPQRGSEERSSKTTTPSEPKVATVSEGAIQNNLEKQQEKKAKSGDALTRTSNKVNPTTSPASNPPSKSQPLEGLGASGLGSKAGGEKPSSSEIGSEQADVNAPTIYTKREGEGSPISQTSTARPVLEENIVLGWALEGSKRTLPIEEEIPIPVTAETKEMATRRNGAGSPSSLNDKKEGHIPGNSGPTAVDQRIPER